MPKTVKKEDARVRIETHRGNQISLDVASNKFYIEDMAEVEPVSSVQEARNAIDRHIATLNKGVRRKVLVIDKGNWDDREWTIVEAELTSWSRHRTYRGIEGVIVKGKNERENKPSGEIYEATPANRKLLEEVVALRKQGQGLIAKADKIIQANKLELAKLPAHLTKEE